MTVVWRYLSFICLLFYLLPAAAGNHISAQAFFEDQTATLDFEQVEQQNFQQYVGILTQGYSKSAFWVRLRIDPGAATDEGKLVLRIRPSYLDEVKLYDPDYGNLGRQVTGDHYPAVQGGYHSLNLNLIVPQGGQPRNIWLRIKTSSTLLMQVQALSLDEALEMDRQQELVASLYLAILAVYVLWGLQYWLLSRELVSGVYVLQQFICLLYMPGLLGFTQNFWTSPAGLTHGLFTDLLMALYVASAIFFNYLLLRDYRPNRHLLRLLKWMLAFVPVYYALMALDHPQWAFQLCMGLIILESFVVVLLALSTPPLESLPENCRPLLPRRTLIVLYTLILLGLSIFLFPAMGAEQGGDRVFDGVVSQSLFSGLAILLVLGMRIRHTEQHRLSLEAAYREAEFRAQAEEARRKEQAQFLAMLTHELRTPLAVVSMALGARLQTPALLADAERSVYDMNAILERCLNVDRLEGRLVAFSPVECKLAEVIAELVHRKPDSERIRFDAQPVPVIQTDPVLLRIVVANLIDNALKYGSEAAPVVVKLELSDTAGINNVVVQVENLPGKTGWPDPDKLFHKYYRHRRAHEHTGTGLGLFLAAHLAELLQGELSYVPSTAQIRFRLCLPL